MNIFVAIMSVIVSIFSLLVTVLIGWQIYQAVNVERKIKRGIEKGLKQSVPMAISVALAQRGMSLHNQGMKADAAQQLLNSFAVLAAQSKYKSFLSESKEYATEKLVEYNKEKLTIKVQSQEEKELYFSAACYTKNKDIVELVNRMEVENESE